MRRLNVFMVAVATMLTTVLASQPARGEDEEPVDVDIDYSMPVSAPVSAAAKPKVYWTCGPKANVRTGMYNIKTVRRSEAWVGPGSNDVEVIQLRRGNKTGWKNPIWWARLTGKHAGVPTLRAGDQADLYWTDYHPDNRYNVCRSKVKPKATSAITWGVNAVSSSANPWGKRLFYAVGGAKRSGQWEVWGAGGAWVVGY